MMRVGTGVAVVDGGQAPSGGFDPLSLTPEAWWDFSDAATVTLNGSNLAQIDDKSPNGRFLNQVTAAQQVNYALAAINGLNAWNPAGVPTKRLGWGVAYTRAQPFTIYAVWRATTNTAGNFLDNGSNRVIIYETSVFGIHAGNTLNAAGPAVDTVAHVFTAVFNGASSVVRLDGTQIAAGNAGANGFAANIGNNLFGGDGGTNPGPIGYLGEVLIQPGAAFSTAYEAALKAKWGTP